MSVLNDEVQGLVKNKYLIRGLPQDIKDWSDDELLKVYHRLLSVYDPGYDVDNPVSKKGILRILSYIRCMGIGYLVSKKDDLTDRSKVLKIITILDNSIDGKYRKGAAAQRVRAVVKQEQLTWNKLERLKKQKQTISGSIDQENVAPNFQNAVSTQKIWLEDAAQGSVEHNHENTPPVSQGFQLPRTPFVTDKLENLKENRTDDISSLTCISHISSSIPIRMKENFQAHDALSGRNVIPSGHQIPRTPKSVDVVLNEERVDNSTFKILNEDGLSTQECFKDEALPGHSIKSNKQGLKVVNQKYVEEFSAASIVSPFEIPIQSNATEIHPEQMSAKTCLKNERCSNMKSYPEHSLSKEEKNGTEKTVGLSTSAVYTSEDNTTNIIAVQTLDSEINATRQACLPSEGTCVRRKTFVICHGHSASDKPNANQFSENKSCTEEFPVSSEQLYAMSMQKKLMLQGAKDSTFTHASSTICESTCNKTSITNDKMTASEICLVTGNCSQKPDGTCSSSPHRQIIPDASPVSTDNLISPQKDKSNVISRQLKLQDQPLSIIGTPELVDASAPLRERKNIIPRGRQLKRTPTGVSPIDEKGTGCILFNSILEGNNKTFEVTVIEPDLDYSLQIFVKGEVPERLQEDNNENCIGSGTGTLAEPGNKILSTVERTQEIGSKIEKMIMPKQIFKEEQIVLQDSSIKKDSGMVNRDLDTMQKCRTVKIKSIETENSDSKNEDLRDSKDLPKTESSTCSVQDKEENCRKPLGSKLLDTDDFDESLQIFVHRKGKKTKSKTTAVKIMKNTGSADSPTLQHDNGFPKTINNILLSKDVLETTKSEKKMRGFSKNSKKAINNCHARENDKTSEVIQENTAGSSKTKIRQKKKGANANKEEKNSIVDQFLNMNPEIKKDEHHIIEEESSQTYEKQKSSTMKPRKGQGKARNVENLPKESAKANLLLITEDAIEMGCKEASADSDKGATLVSERSCNHDADLIENYLTNVKDQGLVALDLNEEANFTLPTRQEGESEPVGSPQEVRSNGNSILANPATKDRFEANAKESVSSHKSTKKQRNSTKQQKQNNSSVSHVVKNSSRVNRASSPYGNAGRKSNSGRSEKCVNGSPKQSIVIKSRKCNSQFSTHASDKLEGDSTNAVEINSLGESAVTRHSIRIQKSKRSSKTSDRLQKNSPLERGVSNSLNKSAVVCLPSSMQDDAGHTKLTGKGSNKTQNRAPRSKRGAAASVSENIDDKNVKTHGGKLNLDSAKSHNSLILEMDKNYAPPKSKKEQRLTGNVSQETAGSNKTSKCKSTANKIEASNKMSKMKNDSGESPLDVKRLMMSVDLSDNDFSHSVSEEVGESIAECSEMLDYKEKSDISNKKSQRKTASMKKASCQVSKVNKNSNKEVSNLSKQASVTPRSKNVSSRISRGRGKKGIESICETFVNARRKRSLNQNNVEDHLQVKKQHIPADLSTEDLYNSASEASILVSLKETLVLKNSNGILDKKSQIDITNQKKERSLASKINKTSSTARNENFLDGSVSLSRFNMSCDKVQKDTCVHEQDFISSEATNYTRKSSRGRNKRGTDSKLEVIKEVNISKKASNKRPKMKNVSGEGLSDVKQLRISVDPDDTGFSHSVSEEVCESISECLEMLDCKEKSDISNKKSQRKTASMKKASCQVSKVNINSNKEDSNLSKQASVSSGSTNLSSRISRGRGKKGIESKCETFVNASRKRSFNQNNVEDHLQVKKQHIPADLSTEDLSNSACESKISVSPKDKLVLKISNGILDKKSQMNITNKKKERSLASKVNKTSRTSRKQNFLDGSISVSRFNISCEVQKDTSICEQDFVSSEATNCTSKSSRERATDRKYEVIEEVKSKLKHFGDKNITQNNQNADDRSTDVLGSVRASRKCKTKASAAIADILENEKTDAYENYRKRMKVRKANFQLKAS